MTRPFADHAQKLIDAGYSPIPIQPGQKFPGFISEGRKAGVKHWQTLCSRQMTPAELEGMASASVEAGIGVALGFGGVIAIDLDSPEGDPVYEALVGIIPDSPVEKVGRKGFTRFFRVDDPTPRKFKLRYTKSGNLDIDGSMGGKPAPVLEILGHGNQTVIPPTVHPGTGKPYEWSDAALSEVPLVRLPTLPADFHDQVEEALAPFGFSTLKAEERERAERSGSAFDDSIFKRINARAMDRIEMWIADLAMGGAKQQGDEWRLRAEWRDGNSETSVRADRNLIHDYGADETISPIDLVMRANMITDVVSAMRWLQEKVSTAEEIEADRTSEREDQMRKEFFEMAELDDARADEDARIEELYDEFRSELEIYIRSGSDYQECLGLASLYHEAVSQYSPAQYQADVLFWMGGNDDDEREFDDDDFDDGGDIKGSVIYSEEAVRDETAELIRDLRGADDKVKDIEEVLKESRGLIRDVFEAVVAEQRVRAPTVAYGAAFALGSLLFSRRWAAVSHGGMRTMAAMYSLVTAPSGAGKTQGAKFVKRVIQKAVQGAVSPEMEAAHKNEQQDPETGDLPEGFQALTDMLKGSVFSDTFFSVRPLIEQMNATPAMLWVVDEAGDFFKTVYDKRAGEQKQLIKRTLKEAVSSQDGALDGMRYANGIGVAPVHYPGMSALFLSTPHLLSDNIPEDVYRDGTVGRMILFHERSSNAKMVVPERRDALTDRIIDVCKDVLTARLKSGEVNQGGLTLGDLDALTIKDVPMSEPALDILWAYHEHCLTEGRRAESVGRIDHDLWSRAGEMATRIALIHALGWNWRKPVITELDMKIGCRLVGASIANWREVAGLSAANERVSEDAKLVRRIIQIIGKHDGVATQRQIQQGSKMRKSTLEPILNDMLASGDIEPKVDTTTTGRVVQKYAITAQARHML